MRELVGAAAFRRLFLQDTPLIDVRAQIEFEKGAFPTACNLPILTTQERAEVGTTYKQQGRQAAVELGHELVRDSIKAERVTAWCESAMARPGSHIYCWRGGMRSQLAAEWMSAAGCEVPVIEGGYRALRRFLMSVTEQVARDRSLLVIGGRTGVAKTPLVRALDAGIDLEHHAHHRGSSFGRHASAPPSQVDFEHRLAVDFLKLVARHPRGEIFLEDESNRIGAVSIPLALFEHMRTAPLVIVEMPLEFRIERIYQEYVVDLRCQYHALDPLDGEQRFRQHLLQSLARIRNRLGGQRYAELAQVMGVALEKDDRPGHESWISNMLRHYYDPMYQYQMDKSEARVIYRGSYDEVLDWCRGRG